MKSRFTICVTAFFAILVAFGTLIPAYAETVDELRSTLKEASTTTREIKETDAKIEGIRQDWLKLKPRIDAHNAQYPSGTCLHPPGRPEVCTPWVEEGKALNAEIGTLKKNLNTYEARKASLKTHLNVLLAKIRISRFLKKCECSGIDTKEALVACYQKCWDNTPNPGYTVPGPAFR